MTSKRLVFTFVAILPLLTSPVFSAITYFGSTSNPADTGSLDGTSNISITPPAGITNGCLLYMVTQIRSLSTTPTISNPGGQSWTNGTVSVGGSSGIRAFWATFNGTWSGNPSVSYGGSTSAATVVMHVFCPTSTSHTWAVDSAEVASNISPPASAPFDMTMAGIATSATSTVSLFVWGTPDDNTWGLQTPGFSNAGNTQYRNLSGSDISISVAYQIRTTAGSTGAVTNRQLTNGGDGTRTLKISFKEVLPSANRTVCSTGCTDTTIASMVSALAPGQIGEIRADSVGGSRTFTGSTCLDLTNKDGGVDNPVTIRVRAGDTVIFDCSTYGIHFSGTDYVVVDGQNGLYVGDVTDWSQSDGGRGYAQNYGVLAVNSSYIALKNATVYGSSNYDGSRFERNSNHVWLKNVTFDLHGTNNDIVAGPNFGLDRGDLVNFSSRYSLIEDCSFSHGGHNPLQATGSYLVMRNTVFDGYWGDKSTGYAGTRTMMLASGDNQLWRDQSVATTEFGPQLLENCILKRSGASVDAAQNAATKVQGRGLIVRGNYFWDNAGVVFLGPGYGETSGAGPAMGRLSIYNNTSYDSYSIYFSTDNAFDPTTMSNLNGEGDWFYNNVFQQVRTGGSPFNAVAVLRDENAVPNGSYSNGWKGGGWDSNIIGGPSTSKQIRLVDTSDTTVSFTNTTQWPSNINRNIDTTLTFVDAAARTKAGFVLDAGNSVGLGDARHITTTTSGGTSDTTLTLANAYPFTDGWTLDFSKIGGEDQAGDCIAVTPTAGGSLASAVVTEIISITSYSAGTVVVSPGVTHVAGSGVWPASRNADGSCGSAWGNRGAAQ